MALSAETISNLMDPVWRHRLAGLTVLDTVDSTNSALQRLPEDQQHAHAILAETQTHGRGRRSRQWYSPPGCNIYLSLGWRFEPRDVPVAMVPLMTAVCAGRALSRAGLGNHVIKWPNDVLIDGRKLAGILVEMQAMAGSQAIAVIGLGMNVHMPADSETGRRAGAVIDREWTDLSSCLPAGTTCSRDGMAALLLDELVRGTVEFERTGFDTFSREWAQRDALAGKTVELEISGQRIEGIALGIDAGGGLRLRRPGREQPETFHAGEVRVFDG